MMKSIDEICNLCNVYHVPPIELVRVYNSYMLRSYSRGDVDKSLELTKRYVRMYHVLR